MFIVVVSVVVFKCIYLLFIFVYLFVGVIVGFSGILLFVYFEEMYLLVEVGIVFLFFLFGLEFLLLKLLVMWLLVFGVGLL